MFSANTEYGGETQYPNTTPYQTAGKSPKQGRFPVQLVCTDQNIEYIWFSKSFAYDTASGTKSFAWKSGYETYPDYIPLASNYYRSRVDAREDVTVDYSPVEGGNGVYVGNYVSTTEEFPLRTMYGGYAIEVPIQNPSALVPPKDASGNVMRATDIPCNGIPAGVNEPYSFQLYVYNGSYSSLSNEISVISNPPELGMWWYEYSNGWTGTLSNGYLRHDQGFVDTKLNLQGSAGVKQGTTSGEIIIEGNVNVSTGTIFVSSSIYDSISLKFAVGTRISEAPAFFAAFAL